MGQLSATLNQRKSGSLPRDTVQNPKNDGHSMVVTTKSDKVISDPIFASDACTEIDDGKGLDLIMLK